MNFFGTSVIDYIFYALVILIALGITVFATIVYSLRQGQEGVKTAAGSATGGRRNFALQQAG